MKRQEMVGVKLKDVNLLTTQAGSEINQVSGQKRDKITPMIKMQGK